jgi:outer membrane immunogenic protein
MCAMIAGVAAAAVPAAHAADFISYPTSTDKSLPISSTSTDTPVDWNGFYAGLYGVGQRSASGGDQYGLGIDAGVSTTFNFVLAGAEVAVQGLSGGTGGTSYVSGLGRAGVLVADNLLAYGAAGYGLDTGAPDQSDLLAGGGVEYGLGNGVSLRAQYLHGFPVTGVNGKDQISLGAQFHF